MTWVSSATVTPEDGGLVARHFSFHTSSVINRPRRRAQETWINGCSLRKSVIRKRLPKQEGHDTPASSRSRRPSTYMYIHVHTVLCLRAGVHVQIGCCAALQFRHRRSSFSNSRRPIFRLASTPREYSTACDSIHLGIISKSMQLGFRTNNPEYRQDDARIHRVQEGD